MKKPVKTLLSVAFFAFAVSFVAGLVGLIVTAFWLGYTNKLMRRSVKREDVLNLTLLVLLMELGFLASGWLHSDLIYNLSRPTTIAIGLASGLLFFFFGVHMKRYQIAKRSYRSRHKRFKWYSFFKIPVFK